MNDEFRDLKLKVVEADNDQALCLVNPDWSNDVAVVLEIIDPRTVKDSPDIARRIAVCVNVCSGFPADALESAKGSVFRKAYKEVEMQRDSMSIVLKKCLTYFHRGGILYAAMNGKEDAAMSDLAAMCEAALAGGDRK